jgi:hypothetical protein
MTQEWVSNVCKYPAPFVMHQIEGQSIVITVEEQLQWRSQFVEGDPQATKQYSVESLKAVGMIGLYREVKE